MSRGRGEVASQERGEQTSRGLGEETSRGRGRRNVERKMTKYANVLNETKARLHFKLYF